MAESTFGRAAPVPKMVQNFVVYFYRHISERNIREIYQMYSHTFPHLSEQYFKDAQWPSAESISPLVDGDAVFLMLYKELIFRHALSRGPASPALRRASWDNYRALFGVALDRRLNARLPNAWLWDVVEAFTSQFQAAALARGKARGARGVEAPALTDEDELDATSWNADQVVALLEELVERSGARQEYATQEGCERLFSTEGYGNDSNVLRMLGYFSLVGLLKVHVLLGAPEAALAALAPLAPLARQRLFATKLALCCVCLFYHAAFAYFSLRRYLDAARCLSFALAYVPRVKSKIPRGHASYDQVLKATEQMYALAALCQALCPAAGATLDDSAASALRERHGDRLKALASGSREAFEDLFERACPKFVPASPDASAAAGKPAAADAGAAAGKPVSANAEAFRAQQAKFLAVIDERKHLPAITSLLGLYASIPAAKLAALAELDEPALLAQLDLLRATTRVVTWSGGDALAGEPVNAGGVDFEVVERDGRKTVVVRSDGKAVAAPSAAFLLGHVQKLREIAAELDAIVIPGDKAAVAAK